MMQDYEEKRIVALEEKIKRLETMSRYDILSIIEGEVNRIFAKMKLTMDKEDFEFMDRMRKDRIAWLHNLSNEGLFQFYNDMNMEVARLNTLSD
jgi:hypothetical protein